MTLSDDEIKALHRKYASTNAAFNLVYTHCQIVDTITVQLLDAKPMQLDRQLVHLGCLLHDIGVYPLIDHTGRIVGGIKHGVVGEQILKEEGFPEAVWRIASHHTGVGLTAQDVIAQQLPIPAADYTPRSDEERLIAYADKFHTKADPSFLCTFRWYREFVGQFGEDKVTKFDDLAELFGIPNLERLSQEFGQTIRDIGS